MKEIKILHLFPNLLSLYGEYGNVAILEKYLSASVTRWEGGELDLTGFDCVYVGSGTEDNLLEAVKRLLPHKEAVAASIDAGTLWLATGNAMTVFGTCIEYQGTTHPSLSVFPYSTRIQAKRYLGDVLTDSFLDQPMIGYVNTSCEYLGIDTPMLVFRLGKELGNVKGQPQDGIRYKNFYGTQLIGPVLVKNPHFLCHVRQTLTGELITLSPESNICKAYLNSLTELSKRI